uniref:Uncharacterized protein n=1 Tax=Lotharella oceanica TaxID=641309 RepID=A0A7S2TZV4_9EUKA
MDRIRSMPPEEVLHRVSAAEEVVQFLNLVEFQELQRCQTLAVLRTNTPPPPPSSSQSSASQSAAATAATATATTAAAAAAPPTPAAAPTAIAIAAQPSNATGLPSHSETSTSSSRSRRGDVKEIKEADVVGELAALEAAVALRADNGVKQGGIVAASASPSVAGAPPEVPPAPASTASPGE